MSVTENRQHRAVQISAREAAIAIESGLYLLDALHTTFVGLIATDLGMERVPESIANRLNGFTAEIQLALDVRFARESRRLQSSESSQGDGGVRPCESPEP